MKPGHPPLTRGQRLRRTANLFNGSTALGILLARAAGLEVLAGPAGLLLAAGYRWRVPVAGAFTVGDVVIFTDRGPRPLPDPRRADPRLLSHEERHARQYALLGAPFLPLYLAAAAWSWLLTGNPGSANVFERLAGLEDGGYPPAQTRRRPGAGPGAGRGGNCTALLPVHPERLDFGSNIVSNERHEMGCTGAETAQRRNSGYPRH